MKKITNLISPILKNYRYRKTPDPFYLFEKLRINETIPPSNKGNVLLLPIRMSSHSNLIEGLMGYAFKLRSYSVHALLCGQYLKKCENIGNNSSFPTLRCSFCNFEQKRFVKSFGIIAEYYNKYSDVKTEQKIKKTLEELSINSILALEYDGVFLGQHIKSALMRYLLSSDVDSERNEYLVKEFAYTTILSYEITKKLLNSLNPKIVISSHGVYGTWGGALEACKKMNIKIIIWGEGYIGGNIIASHNESYLSEKINEPTIFWENLELTNFQKNQLKDYFNLKRNPNSTVDHVNYYKDIGQSNLNLIEILNLDKSRVRFGLYPNIPWDGTTFSSTEAFPNIKTFIEKTFQWFEKNTDCDLIIRAHPAEKLDKSQEKIKDIIDSVSLNLPSNVYFLDSDSPFTSYDVDKISDCAITYASTMCLELAYFGKTVIQTGQCNTSNKGFIFEAKNVQEYFKLLEKAAKRQLNMNDKMKDRAKKYAYHWLFRSHIENNIYKHKNLNFVEYNIDSSMDLLPGKNKFLDEFISRCEEEKPFIWDN